MQTPTMATSLAREVLLNVLLDLFGEQGTAAVGLVGSVLLFLCGIFVVFDSLRKVYGIMWKFVQFVMFLVIGLGLLNAAAPSFKWTLQFWFGHLFDAAMGRANLMR